MRRTLPFLIAVLLSACAGLPISEPTAAPIPPAQSPLAIVAGDLRYTGNLIDDRGDHAVMLVDLYGFVKRDSTFEPSAKSQVLGTLQLNPESRDGRFELHLPALPSGRFSDLDDNATRDRGVQIFNLIWWTNEFGGPFADRDDQLRGWGQSYASTIHDTNSDGEITGGKIIVWSPDAAQRFPTDFGADLLLFTADDPLGTIAPGYTVIDLDKRPFVHGRTPEETLSLYERGDYVTKDYSDLSYSEAFERMVQSVRQTYAFTGMPDREPDWEQLLPIWTKQIQQAEQDKDAIAYYRALREFSYAFRDGHVAIDGGNIEEDAFEAEFGGGFGFGTRELDDGRFLVSFVQHDGPAQEAGMRIGAELLAFNNQPIGDAIVAVMPFAAPYSTRAELRYQQLRYLLRTKVGSETEITFRNPTGEDQTVTLKAVDERESLDATSIYAGLDSWGLPVEHWYLDDQIGNILIATNADDAELTLSLFERALDAFEADDVDRIVLDFRQNDGGALLGLAGFFAKEDIPMAQELQRDTITGEFETRGAPFVVRPKGRIFAFKQIAVLVGYGCASACEAEVYALSTLPNVKIVGQYPTSGMFSAVIGEEYIMPELFTFQFSKWRYQTADGRLFLEGQGVVPTIQVPINEDTVLDESDVVRQAALEAIRER